MASSFSSRFEKEKEKKEREEEKRRRNRSLGPCGELSEIPPGREDELNWSIMKTVKRFHLSILQFITNLVAIEGDYRTQWTGFVISSFGSDTTVYKHRPQRFQKSKDRALIMAPPTYRHTHSQFISIGLKQNRESRLLFKGPQTRQVIIGLFSRLISICQSF